MTVFVHLFPCRAAIYQWCPGPHWPWRPSDQRSHSHPLWSHHAGCPHQITLQHKHMAGQCAECNRFVGFYMEGMVVFEGAHLSVCSPGNPLSLVDLVPLLQKTLKDESSVTCKMACYAVRVRQICASKSAFSSCLWVWVLCVCVSALHYDSVQQHPEWAWPAVGGRPVISQIFFLLACSYWAPGNFGWDGLSVG